MKRCLTPEDCLESVKTQLSDITTPKINSRLQPSSRTEPEHWSPPKPLGPESRNALTRPHVGVRGGGDRDSGPSGCEGDYLFVKPLISL